MGLDVSHDAFHGAYSAFNRFRKAVAESMGGSYPPHDDKSLDPEMWYWGTGANIAHHPGLFVFFNHSDCDGAIHWKDCFHVALEVEALLPELDAMVVCGGHIEAQGGYGAVARKFILGCRAAFDAKEDLVFA